jgi:hypothetical protein
MGAIFNRRSIFEAGFWDLVEQPWNTWLIPVVARIVPPGNPQEIRRLRHPVGHRKFIRGDEVTPSEGGTGGSGFAALVMSFGGSAPKSPRDFLRHDIASAIFAREGWKRGV